MTELPASAIEALKQGRKIDAIKHLREGSGIGLKAAKEQVEDYLQEHPELQLQTRGGGTLPKLSNLIAIVCVLVIAYYILNSLS